MLVKQTSIAEILLILSGLRVVEKGDLFRVPRCA